MYTSSDPMRYALAWRWIPHQFQNEVRGGANLAPVQFITDWDYSAGILYNTALGIINPVAGNGRPRSWRRRLPGSGPLYEYLPVEQQRLADARTPRTADGRELAAQRRQPVQLPRSVPAGVLGLQRGGARRSSAGHAQFPGGISATDLAPPMRSPRGWAASSPR